MSKKYILLYVLILPIICSFLESYGNDKKKFKEAQNYYYDGDFRKANELFLELLKVYPNDTEILYALAHNSLASEKYEVSLRYFNKAYKITKGQIFEIVDLYYLGYLNHITHRFDEAKAKYTLFKIKMKREGLSEIYLPEFDYDIRFSDVQNKIKQCNYAQELVKTPVDVEILPLTGNINTKWLEYAPVVSADLNTMIYTTRRPECQGEPTEDGLYPEDIYISKRDKTGIWQKGSPINKNQLINTVEHDATVALSADAKELIIYRNKSIVNIFKKNKNFSSGDLFTSYYDNGQWSEPIPLPKTINSDYWEASASVTADGKKIFFTSDRPGGFGGVDIYLSEKTRNGLWGKAKNLGSIINTKYDEDAPYINIDGSVLHFASKGHDNMGGYDIFTSKYNFKNHTWSEVENMGYPINTSANDTHFAWSPDGSIGYFSSERSDGQGLNDIYTIHFPESRFKFIALRGKVYDQETGDPIQANIEIYDNEKHVLIEMKKSDSKTGDYSFTLPPGKNYGIYFIKEGYLFKSRNFYQPNQFEYIDYYKDIYLKRLEDKALEDLKNTFFDKDENYLSKLSRYDLIKLKSFAIKNPNQLSYLRLIYTCDVKDTTKYNKIVNENAKDIEKQLEALNIDENQIVIKPIIHPVSYPPSKSHEVHRSIEYYSVDKNKNNEISKITSYIEATEITETSDNTNSDQRIKKLYEELNKKEITQGNLLIEEMINFENNVSGRDDKEFENIVEKVKFFIEKYPRLVIEVGGYTDSKGSDVYNLKLSKTRADFVRQRLITEGINPSRLVSKGYGEKAPIADNTSEEGRILNRRVEFKVSRLYKK